MAANTRPALPVQQHAQHTGEGLESIVRHLQGLPRAISPSELLMASADEADEPLESAIPALLAMVKGTLDMDVVFVSEFIEGRRVFKHVDVPAQPSTVQAGAADPLEASWCQRVVDGRVPGYMADAAVHVARGELAPPAFPVGTHLSVPIVLQDGRAFGTVCCFSFAVNPAVHEADLSLLQAVAAMLAAGENRRRLTAARAAMPGLRG